MNLKQNNSALSEFISTKEWHWFLTFTTSYDSSYSSARRLANRYFKNIHKLSGLSKYQLFYTIEPHKLKGGTHIHALLNTEFNNSVNDKLMFNFLVEQWQKTAGRKKMGQWQRNKVSKIKGDNNAVTKYCVKYITKETELTWDYLLTGHTNFIN